MPEVDSERMRPPTYMPYAIGIALSGLSEVHYDLKEFDKSQDTAMRALFSVPPYLVGSLYQMISISYLRSGSYDAALKTAEDYVTRVSDPQSVRWLRLVREYNLAAQSSLDSLEAPQQLAVANKNLAIVSQCGWQLVKG